MSVVDCGSTGEGRRNLHFPYFKKRMRFYLGSCLSAELQFLKAGGRTAKSTHWETQKMFTAEVNVTLGYKSLAKGTVYVRDKVFWGPET